MARTKPSPKIKLHGRHVSRSRPFEEFIAADEGASPSTKRRKKSLSTSGGEAKLSENRNGGSGTQDEHPPSNFDCNIGHDKNSRLQRLFHHAANAEQAWKFIDENRNKFQKTVWGPIAAEIVPKNKEVAAYIEHHLGEHFRFLFTAYLVECREDKMLLYNELKNKRGIDISLIYFEQKKDVKHILGKYSDEEMELLRKDHGFWGTMDEMFAAPCIIKYFLVDKTSMKHVLVGGDEVQTSIEKENLIELLANYGHHGARKVARGKRRDSCFYYSHKGRYLKYKNTVTGYIETFVRSVENAKLLWPETEVDPGMYGDHGETNSDAEELACESSIEGNETEPSSADQCPDPIGQAQTSRDTFESAQTLHEQNESLTVNSDSLSDEMGGANENDEHNDINPGDFDVEEMPLLGQAINSQSNFKNADTIKSAPALTRQTAVSGQTEAPQTAATPQGGIIGEVGTNNHTETNASASSSQVAREMSELELGPLYKDIKGKARSKSKDEKKFYGHLKQYFARKLFSGNLLSKVEFDKIKTFMARYESNLKLLDDKGNDYYDICVYRGFLQHIMSECERELALSDVV